MTRFIFIMQALSIDTEKCIFWPYAIRKSSGYGAYSEGRGSTKKSYDVHRYACERAHGPAPKGFEASHSCGNKLCINRKHLRWASHLDNMSDAIQHGTLRGGGRYRQRISLYDRAVIQASSDSLLVLAKRYKSDPAYIGRIRRAPMQYDL